MYCTMQYIYKYTFLVCLSVRLYSKIVITRLNHSGPNFVWDLAWPQGRFIDAQNYKKLSPSWYILYSTFMQYINKDSALIQVFIEIQRNSVFDTNSNFLIPISIQPNGVNLWYFKLRLFDLTDFIVLDV